MPHFTVCYNDMIYVFGDSASKILGKTAKLAGFSNFAGARRKSPATSNICAGYFLHSKFYYSNYTILFYQSNRDLIFLRK